MTSRKKNSLPLIWLGVIILIILASKYAYFIADKFSPDNYYKNYAKNFDIEETASTKMDRQRIINAFEKPKVGFSFEENAPINGQENYVGIKDRSVIQLLGPADNLMQASILIEIGPDPEEAKILMLNVMGLVNAIDKTATPWFAAESLKLGEEEFTSSEIFNDKIFEIHYTPSSGPGFYSILDLVIAQVN